MIKVDYAFQHFVKTHDNFNYFIIMEITIQHIIFFATGLLFGCVTMALIVLKKNHKNNIASQKEIILLNERLQKNDSEMVQLKNDLSLIEGKQHLLQSEKNDIVLELAVKKQEITQLSTFEQEAKENRNQITTLSNSCSEMDEKLKQFKETKDTLAKLELTLETLRNENKKQTGQIAELREQLKHFDTLATKHKSLQDQYKDLQDISSIRQAEIATISTLLQKEKDSSVEKIALLSKAKEEMADRFKTVAQEIFEDKGIKFHEKQEKDLGVILDPLKEQLSSFNKRINDIHESSSKDQASLRQELETLRRSNLDLNKEAKNLSQALKGDQKIQGNWGEMILEKVLEHSGLRKGIEYETQAGLRDDNNKLFKPDIIVHLPEGRDVVIDSKVSLVAYETSCAATTDHEKEQALTAHVLSVKKHIQELSNKDYSNLQGLKSPDFVLMFMPIEPAFIMAFQKDEGLFQYGFERRIIVVTPSTLLATLRTIENIWRFERQNQNTKEIADRASKIYEKIRLFLASMDDLGKQLGKAQSTYDIAFKRLSLGRGNLVNQAVELKKLGIKVKKEFPQHLVDNAANDLIENKSQNKIH